MVRKLIEWGLDNPLVVVLLAIALAGFGSYAFLNVNIEAYPDPAPAIIEVVTQYPGASAEEVERLVTIPLEVALSGMPGLKYKRSKSLFGLSHIRNQFDYGVDYEKARQQVINRLAQAQSQLPAGAQPQISPQTPTGELMRYMLMVPKDARGRDIYTLADIKALQDWTLQRTFKRINRIADVTGFGGAVKRYEIHPDVELLQKNGVTLQQLVNAISASNSNVGADLLSHGHTMQVVRSLGLIGGGQDPMQMVQGKTPQEANDFLRTEEDRRLREIGRIVLAATNNVPVRIDNILDTYPGPSASGANGGPLGVEVGHQTRLGKVSYCRVLKDKQGNDVHDANGERVWIDEDDTGEGRNDKVQGILLMRKNEDSLPALKDLHDKIEELNKPGRLLPGVKLEVYYDRTHLVNRTTETVRENLLVGMVLVTVILLMFLSNVRSALIVAINIPLALLFAFSVLYLRGKSANLLSIGAVDFGIIVDSSVIMVENIYRHVAAGEHADLPLKRRIILACHEVEKPLFFSTTIMVCAFIPLFTMQGPEGQIFGPMADTYAFALGGALLLALLLAPVLCLLFFRHLKPADDNFLVRWLKRGYLRQLERCLAYRGVTLAIFGVILVATAIAVPFLGGEFMPELEEGNLWIRGTFPVNVALEEAAQKAHIARTIIRQYPEVAVIASQVGRPDDGTDPTGFYNLEINVPLKPENEWPSAPSRNRPRTRVELEADMNAELKRKLPGIDWGFSQYIRDNVMEALSGVKGDNSVKIFGPDLEKLEELAVEVKNTLNGIRGMEDVGIFRIKGQSNLEFQVDREKCAFWNLLPGDVHNTIQATVGGKPASQMIEGEKTFDITVRLAKRWRDNEDAVLRIPIDVTNHTVTPGAVASILATPSTGPSAGVPALGTSLSMPSLVGSMYNATFTNLSSLPRLEIRHVVSPLGKDGLPDPNLKSFSRPGASTIYREQDNRFIAIKFDVHGRDLAGTVAEAQEKVAPLIQPPYRTEWSGEFQEMEEANRRLLLIVPVSLGMIFVLLYLTFHSAIDALLVFSNVVALSVGGIWALLLTGTHFSISAAVGFISIFGVAIMDGLLLVSYFNHLRAQGLSLQDAIMQGAEKRVRPVMMTALTAIFGLLPAALSTRIGAQTQRPLAIVVVGGMITTLFLTRYLMPVLYSFYGHRELPAAEGAGVQALGH
jgi:cobalt-zinc-cadmium resistance protein CzcA